MITRAGLTIFERGRIGLDPPTRSYSSSGKITHVSIHHGGREGRPRMTFAAAAATWRSWQNYHQHDPAHGWIDIGYNLGIDGLGRLYKGRPIGALPAAVGGHNSGSVGIVFIQDGNYALTPAARAALKVLFEQGIPELGLPKLKNLVRDPRPGVGVFGHKEYSGHHSNECPGTAIFRHLVWRRGRYS
jgi:hypothetical protein